MTLWSRRRDLRLWRRASSEQGEFRGRPPLANATLSPPAPPLPTNLLLRKIFAGSLSSAYRAVQFAPIRYVSEQFARKPLALRSRLHPQIPSMFVTTKKRADTNRLSFPWSRRRDYPRLYGQAESRGFYERLDGFADAGVRSREPTAENKASHFQTFRRLWFKPLTTAKTPRRQKCHLGVLVEATGFEPTTSWSRTKRATKLRYASNVAYYIKTSGLLQAILRRCIEKPRSNRAGERSQNDPRRACKPGSVERGHLSTPAVTGGLKRYSRLCSDGQPI